MTHDPRAGAVADRTLRLVEGASRPPRRHEAGAGAGGRPAACAPRPHGGGRRRDPRRRRDGGRGPDRQPRPATGFDRAADRADLPDVIARFDNTRAPSFVDRRVRALPDVAARSFRLEITNVQLSGNGQRPGRDRSRCWWPAVAGLRDRGRARRANHRGGEVVVERGVADRFGLGSGTSSTSAGSTCAWSGSRSGPTTSRSPLARTARVYVPRARSWPVRAGAGQRGRAVAARPEQARRGPHPGARRDLRPARPALRDPRRRAGHARPGRGPHRGLLSAFALVDPGGGALMLRVRRGGGQRRMRTIGVQRALGFSRGQVTLQHGVEGALLARPRRRRGRRGRAGPGGPTGDLLATLNGLPPGAASCRGWPSPRWPSSAMWRRRRRGRRGAPLAGRRPR